MTNRGGLKHKVSIMLLFNSCGGALPKNTYLCQVDIGQVFKFRMPAEHNVGL